MDYPAFPASTGPHCYGLPSPAVPFPGVTLPGNGDGAPNREGTANRTVYSANGPGSPAETRLVSALISAPFGGNPANVPPIATVLAAPMLRGSQVSAR